MIGVATPFRPDSRRLKFRGNSTEGHFIRLTPQMLGREPRKRHRKIAELSLRFSREDSALCTAGAHDRGQPDRARLLTLNPRMHRHERESGINSDRRSRRCPPLTVNGFAAKPQELARGQRRPRPRGRDSISSRMREMYLRKIFLLLSFVHEQYPLSRSTCDYLGNSTFIGDVQRTVWPPWLHTLSPSCKIHREFGSAATPTLAWIPLTRLQTTKASKTRVPPMARCDWPFLPRHYATSPRGSSEFCQAA